MKKVLNITCIAFILLAKTTFGQFDNTGLKESIPVDSVDARWVKFRISNDVFMKNYEYFNKIATGFTLFGDMFSPSFSWNPNPYFRIQAGVFLRKDFGSNNFYQVIPTISMKAQKNGFAFVVGTLEGNINHGLIQPMFDFDRYMDKHVENGAQVLINKKKIQSDLWIDWERMIYPGSDFMEVITSGLNFRGIIIDNPDVRVTIPVQSLIHHFGGQINSNQGDHIITLWNNAFGLTASHLSNTGLIREIRSDNYYTISKNLSPFKENPDSSGWAWYFNLLIKTKYHCDLMLSYWNGYYYIAPLGAPLYQSQSSIDPTYFERRRQLLLASLMYEKELFKNFYVNVRFEPYYDMQNELFEYSYGAYFTYRTEFRLVNLRKSATPD